MERYFMLFFFYNFADILVGLFLIHISRFIIYKYTCTIFTAFSIITSRTLTYKSNQGAKTGTTYTRFSVTVFDEIQNIYANNSKKYLYFNTCILKF